MNHETFFKITYGLYVVSSTNGSQGNGFVANAVFQVTAKPARFAVACNKDNFTCGLMEQSKAFAISILHQDTKSELIGLFGYKSGRALNKFASVRHRTGQTGTPILLEDALAWFECKVVQRFDVGTHVLFIGEVIDGDVTGSAQPPMTYAYYQDVKKGKAPKNAPTYIAPADAETVDDAPLPASKFVCVVCDHAYDPTVGDPDAGVPPGTRFEDLPQNWACPVCGAAKSDFVKQP